MSRLPTRRLKSVVETLVDVAEEVQTCDSIAAIELRAHAEAITRVVSRLDAVPQIPLLTPAQSRVLAYVHKHIESRGEVPTRKEIADHFSYASPNAAQTHLRALERKGFLTLTGNVREIQLNDPSRISQ